MLESRFAYASSVAMQKGLNVFCVWFDPRFAI